MQDTAQQLGLALRYHPRFPLRPRPGATRHEYPTPQRMIGGQPVDELEPGAALRFQDFPQSDRVGSARRKSARERVIVNCLLRRQLCSGASRNGSQRRTRAGNEEAGARRAA